MALDVSMILRLVDRFSGPARRAQSAARQFSGQGGLGGVSRASGAAARALDRVKSATGRMPSVFARASAAARSLGQKSLPLLERAAFRTGQGIGTLLRKGASLGVQAATWGAGLAAAGTGWFAGGILRTASDFEQFQVILENTEGSAEKARDAMRWVREFAKTTPYEVAQVMEAYVALKSYGLDPMDGTLKSLGNSASGMNKSIMQAVEMLADAQTGEFERLKEFGIRASVQGKNVSFTYQKAGKDVVRTARNSGAEIRNALVGIMDERFGGMMDRQSRTLSGLWSNLKDMFSGFMLDIADAGFFDYVKGRVQALLDKVKELADNGTLKRWAETLSEKFIALGQWAERVFRETKWEEVGNDLRSLASAAAALASAFARAYEFGQKLSFLKWANPVYTGSRVIGRLGELMPGRGAASGPPARPDANRPNTLPRSRIIDPNRPNITRPLPKPAVGQKSAMVLDNRLRIEVASAPGVSASVKPVKTAPGTTLQLNRGRAMAGAA